MRAAIYSNEIADGKFHQSVHADEKLSCIWFDFIAGNNSIEIFVSPQELRHVFNEMTLAVAKLEELLEKLETAEAVEKWSDIVPASPPSDDNEVPF